MTEQPKNVILQRDGSTYALATRIPAGLVRPEDLEQIAAVAKEFAVPMIKISSGQRFLLVGIPENRIRDVERALGTLAERKAGPCVRYVQACPGTDTCMYGMQDSITFARTLEEKYHGMAFPAKLKIGVSGCQRNCGESQVRDVGVMGTNRGWTVYFGGNSGRKPRIGDLVAENLSAEETLDLVHRLLEYYRDHAKQHERTARFMERIGIETIRSELLTLLPYIPLRNPDPSG